jgi:microcystin-dependent protein
MPLESATYISELNASNPSASDVTAQGDDHIRLVKAVLAATFPGASKAFRFPTAEAASATDSVDATEQNKIFTVDATSGAKTFTLPSGLVTADAGWSCEFLKTDTSANAVIVAPPSGTISGLASMSITSIHQRIKAIWNGSAWFGMILGRYIGELVPLGGATLPPLCLWPAGGDVSRTTYAALFAHWGTTHGSGNGSTTFGTLDLRGRMMIGKDNMGGSAANRVTNSVSGITGTTLGSAGGAQSVALAIANLPSHNHSYLDVDSHLSGGRSASHNHGYTTFDDLISIQEGTGGSRTNIWQGTSTVNTDTEDEDHTHTTSVTVNSNSGSTGSGDSINKMPPGLIVNVAIYAGA